MNRVNAFLYEIVRAMKSISAVLREAVSNCGLSQTQLSKETGVPQPTITRFVNGKHLQLQNADVLAAFLGFHLVPIEPKAARRAAPKSTEAPEPAPARKSPTKAAKPKGSTRKPKA